MNVCMREKERERERKEVCACEREEEREKERENERADIYRIPEFNLHGKYIASLIGYLREPQRPPGERGGKITELFYLE